MGLIVDSISVEGFGSYSKPQTLVLGGRGPVAITGANGAGKSTVVSKALTWCLYDKTAPERMGGGVKVLRGDHVISDDAPQVVVTVRLSDPDSGTAYEITRQKPRKRKGDLRIVRIDGDKTNDIDASDEAIEAIVGASWEVFTRTVVRGQGDLWAFSEATDSKKREVLDAISGADSLTKAYDRALAMRKAAGAKALEYSRRSEDLQRRARGVRVASLKADMDEWTAGCTKRLMICSADVESHQKAYDDAVTTDATATADRKRRQELEASKPALDFTPYQQAVTAAREECQEASNKLHEATTEDDRLQGLEVGCECPTCGQAVAEDAPIALKAATARQEVADATPPAQEAANYLQTAEEAMTAANEWLQSEIESWQASIDKIPHAQAKEPLAKLALETAKRRLEAEDAADNPYAVACRRAVEQRQALTREAALLREMAATQLADEAKAQAWQDALHPRGVRAHMASGSLAAIEKAANEWLTVLSDNRIAVEFPEDQEKEKIGTTVTMDGITRDLLTYSGGERRRINMAVDLGVAAAFSKGGLSLSLLVLDEEVFSGMDEAGKAAVVHALHGSGVADVVVVDHDPRLSAVLPRTVEVSRDADNHSVIKEIERC